MADEIIEELPPKKKKQPVKYSWTQPCCAECWVGLKVKIGNRIIPAGMHHPFKFPAFCCFCRAQMSKDNAYQIRVNPGATPYPTVKKEEE